MAVLTTSQLTFYDYKDSYSVEINPDCIVINCDEKCISKDITEVNISYSVYCGRSRVSGTAVLDFEINGEKIEYTVQDCSSEVDGSIQFSIPANIDFTNIESVHIIFSELSGGDGDTFTFDKYVQFVKAVDGASGAGLVFKVYSENGTVFREDMDEITLETALFIGESRVELDEDKYTWEYNNVRLGNGSNFTVNRDDEYAFKTIKCRINYNDIDYEDYISLTNEVNIYTSEVKYFKGSNIFSHSDSYLIAYMALYKNGEEIDLLPTYKCATNPVPPIDDSTRLIDTNVKKEDKTEFGTDDAGTLMYFIVKDDMNDVIAYNMVLGEFNGTEWHTTNEPYKQYECVYSCSKSSKNLTKSLVYSELDKIMAISKEQIDKTLAISFNAYKKSDVTSSISVAVGSVIDTNDPYIGTDPPDNPVSGTLWMNIKNTPYVLKVCKISEDGKAEWTDVNQQIGAVYTSIPYSYFAGDIWILNDGEACRYTDQNGILHSYGPGSMLKSSTSRTTDEIEEMVKINSYPFSDWLDTQSKFTEMKDNIEQYFSFDSVDGLTIGRQDEKFYVNIKADEMGFYEVAEGDTDGTKVVSIGSKTATIKNANIQDSATFECKTDFKKQINMYNEYSTNMTGFTWKFETDGSLSLVVIS